MPVYLIQPQDLLFFRDARPMESQSPGGGHGAVWPHPGVFHDALHAALWRAFPATADRTAQGFEHHGFYRQRNGIREQVGGGGGRRMFFQTLSSAGPFPVKDGVWFYPAAADAQPGGGLVLPIETPDGVSDLPPPLSRPVVSAARPSKEAVLPWWSRLAFERYLADGTVPGLSEGVEGDALFAAEWTTGIGTDPATGTQDGERIYSAEYLRLRDEVRLGLWATLPEGPAKEERLDRLFPPNGDAPMLVVGGQQRSCRVVPEPGLAPGSVLPRSQGFDQLGTRVKWVLLSPAVFPATKMPDGRDHPGGWLPTWIDPGEPDRAGADGGRVRLQRIETAPRSGTPVPRKERRAGRGAVPLTQCRLVAACVPKPVSINGWTEACHLPEEPATGGATAPVRRSLPGPRGTQLAVPPGAVYYFECDSPAAARELWLALSWHGADGRNTGRVLHRRSSVLGEKGFGLGVCGPWNYFPGPGNGTAEAARE